ncbi:MAG: carboxypeptidase regulatory-like domain-containing protein [Planctomycetes bacterium]|nr:carboxypeptidase regulatory-like domain-containing protein [Planctomycetota bacterium]
MRRPTSLLALAALAVGLPAQAAPPLLRDHVERTSALAREHQYHASVAGRVLADDGAPARGATVLVFGHQPYYWALPLARTTTDEHGEFRCDDVNGTGKAVLWVVAPDDTPFRAMPTPITLVSGRSTRLRPLTLPAAGTAGGAATTFRGRVLAGDGRPIPGVLLRLLHPDDAFDPSAYAVTDADGAFTIPVRTGTPGSAQLFLGRQRLDIEHEAGTAELAGDPPRLRLDLTGERTLQCPAFRWLPVPHDGVDGLELGWRLGHAFQPCVDGHAPVIEGPSGHPSATVRVSAPGHLPRLGSVPGTTFSLALDVARELRVVDPAGDPVAGALVDLCDAAWGERFQEAWLGTYLTAADGTLRLRAPAAAEVVVYAYADGYAPARTVWTGAAPQRVEVTRRTARLRIDLDDAVSTIYVRRAGTFDLEAMAYPDAGGLELELAPGTYEVTRYRDGPAAAAKAVTLGHGDRTQLRLDADDRPTLAVTVPELAGEGSWWVHAGRSAFGGMVAKRAIWTERGGPMPTRELVAEVEPDGERRFRLRLPTSGRYTLFVGHERLPHRLLREVVVGFGERCAIELPPLDGVLLGSIAAMPEAWGHDFAMDGIAGPRLWLEPVGDTAFGALVTLPEPSPFRVEHLPRGSFTLHHHLYATGYFRGEGGTWGGQQVTIGAEAADGGELAQGPDGELQVRVRWADGSPASGRLAVRDRMYESWQQVVRGNSTLVFASDPIPAPPSARLVAGTATLGRVRSGRLGFELLGDDGATVFFVRDVVPGTPLEVQLAVRR